MTIIPLKMIIINIVALINRIVNLFGIRLLLSASGIIIVPLIFLLLFSIVKIIILFNDSIVLLKFKNVYNTKTEFNLIDSF